MEEGFFSRRNRTSFLFSISVNFSVLTKSLRSGEKKGFLALYPKKTNAYEHFKNKDLKV